LQKLPRKIATGNCYMPCLDRNIRLLSKCKQKTTSQKQLWFSQIFIQQNFHQKHALLFSNKNPSKCRCFDNHFFNKKNDGLLMGFCWKFFASGVLNVLLSILRTKARSLFYYYVELKMHRAAFLDANIHQN